MHEALWPSASAEEHAQEISAILAGTFPLTMPLIILVAEASDRKLVGFLEVHLRSHADGCNPARAVGYVEGWYIADTTDIRESARNLYRRPKTGHATRDVSRWRPIHGSTTRARNALTKP